MTFAKIIDGTVSAYPYADWQIRADHPQTSFPADMSAVDLSGLGIVSVASVVPPSVSFGEMVVEGLPALINGMWQQTWVVEAIPAPMIITMRQARLALLGAGLLDDVNAAIDALPEPNRSAAQIEWEYAAEVRRDSRLIAVLASALGLDETQVDALFITGASL